MGNADLLTLIERMLQDQGDDSGTMLSANRKLVDLARDLALTGELPDDPAGEPSA